MEFGVRGATDLQSLMAHSWQPLVAVQTLLEKLGGYSGVRMLGTSSPIENSNVEGAGLATSMIFKPTLHRLFYKAVERSLRRYTTAQLCETRLTK
jgi:hypothetical protein